MSTDPSKIRECRRRMAVESQCAVCSVAARYSYYGATVCPSCKMFFKRNAEKPQESLRCHFDGHCEINFLTRHTCSSCRLKKCFASGMQVALFRASVTTKKKKTEDKKENEQNATMASGTRNPSNALVAVTNHNQLQQFPTLNLLQADSSTLTADQWTLLSNLIHCYDDYSGMSASERYIREQSTLPVRARYKVKSVNDFYVSLTSGAQLLFEKNAHYRALSVHDRSLLLHTKLKYVGGLGSAFILHQVRLLDNATFYTNTEETYGAIATAAARCVGTQYDSDVVFFKLLLAIIVFSTFDYTVYMNSPPINLENPMQVLHIQDMYIEVAWRYFVQKYGYERAVVCFMNLIRCIFTINQAIVEVVEVKTYNDIVDDVIKQTEENLSLGE